MVFKDVEPIILSVFIFNKLTDVLKIDLQKRVYLSEEDSEMRKIWIL
ncbi:hypothetical protein LMG8526_1036 [Lactococcus lactis subsp. lactis]|uniref:Uncharacterized protein n=1 Tax=Lactococcus lactis subsp. lactis TaxID=1360 RepID=A0A0V8DF83_LACLL|nr:hypothetical protein KF282_2266 [Lactococcus lactis subsp. lactis]KSU12236.1 hypothetical protein LMG8526_1036 [Lactococcus lactis subsp. lactis]